MSLFFCGYSLIFLQLILNWHLGPVLHSSELPWLLLSCTALLGQAAGYGWRQRRWPLLFLTVCWTTPLLAALLRAVALPPWATLAASAALAVASSFPLAYLISQLWSGHSLRSFYRVELGGALVALLTALLFSPPACTFIFPWAVLLGAWSRLPRITRPLACLLPLLSSVGFPQARWQAASHAYQPHQLLAQQISAYQYVEVVETPTGRAFFLNGLCHYGPDAYNRLNFYLGPLAASRISPEARRAGCLMLGAGTFVAPALVAESGVKTTVIELDPAVVGLGMTFFEQARPKSARFEILTGDARRLLAEQPPQGLIVVNLPSPYNLNVASMFTVEFYRSIKARLVQGGACSVFLGAPLEPTGANSVQGPILAALLEVFPEALAVSSHGFDNTVVLVSGDPLGETAEVRRYLRTHGQNRFTLYTRPQLQALAGNFQAASLNDLRLCSALNRLLWEIP